MTSMFNTLVSILLGVALAAYGLFHAVRGYPGPDTWSRMADAVPTLGAVSFFLLGVAIAVAGVTLAARSVNRWRRRPRQQRRPADGRRDGSAGPRVVHASPASSSPAAPDYGYDDGRGNDRGGYAEADYDGDPYGQDGHPHYGGHGYRGSQADSNGRAWAGGYRG